VCHCAFNKPMTTSVHIHYSSLSFSHLMLGSLIYRLHH